LLDFLNLPLTLGSNVRLFFFQFVLETHQSSFGFYDGTDPLGLVHDLAHLLSPLAGVKYILKSTSTTASSGPTDGKQIRSSNRITDGSEGWSLNQYEVPAHS